MLPQFGQHGGVVDVEVFADPCQRPAEVVEVDGVVDLVGGEATSAHRHSVPVEDVADRSSVDAEPGTQLVGGGARQITLDQRLDLVGVELLCLPWFQPIGGRWSRGRGVGQLS